MAHRRVAKARKVQHFTIIRPIRPSTLAGSVAAFLIRNGKQIKRGDDIRLNEFYCADYFVDS